MRDAQSLLEQVLSFSKGEVTERDALAQLGIVPLLEFHEVMRGAADGSAREIVDELNSVASSGADMQRYAAYLSDGIRALRLLKNGVDIRAAAGFSTEEYRISHLSRICFMMRNFHVSSREALCYSRRYVYIQNDLACSRWHVSIFSR
jgi:DNA polymerase-3 subunit gamma/tau